MTPQPPTTPVPAVLRHPLDVTKERLEVARAAGRDSFQPVVLVGRDDDAEIVAIVFVDNRDHALEAMWLAAPMFRADSLTFCIDAYVARPRFYDEFDRNPDPGELQRLFLAGRTDVAGESLMLSWVHRDGRLLGAVADYRVSRKGRKVDWLREAGGGESEEEGYWSGLVADGMRQCIAWRERLGELGDAMASIHDQAREDKAEMLRLDFTAARNLAAAGFAVKFPFPVDPDLAEVIQEVQRKAAEDQLTLIDESGSVIVGPDIDRRSATAQIGELVRPRIRDDVRRSHQQDMKVAARNRAERRAQRRG